MTYVARLRILESACREMRDILHIWDAPEGAAMCSRVAHNEHPQKSYYVLIFSKVLALLFLCAASMMLLLLFACRSCRS